MLEYGPSQQLPGFRIAVEAIDASGAKQNASVSVDAEPGDLPPNAVVNVRTLSGNTVLACSAGSNDPDGFLLSWHYRFSDGAEIFTPAAVHTFGSPGMYSVGLTVMDQFGAPGSTSQSFSILSSSAQHAALAESPKRKPYPIRRP